MPKTISELLKQQIPDKITPDSLPSVSILIDDFCSQYCISVETKTLTEDFVGKIETLFQLVLGETLGENIDVTYLQKFEPLIKIGFKPSFSGYFSECPNMQSHQFKYACIHFKPFMELFVNVIARARYHNALSDNNIRAILTFGLSLQIHTKYLLDNKVNPYKLYAPPSANVIPREGIRELMNEHAYHILNAARDYVLRNIEKFPIPQGKFIGITYSKDRTVIFQNEKYCLPKPLAQLVEASKQALAQHDRADEFLLEFFENLLQEVSEKNEAKFPQEPYKFYRAIVNEDLSYRPFREIMETARSNMTKPYREIFFSTFAEIQSALQRQLPMGILNLTCDYWGKTDDFKGELTSVQDQITSKKEITSGSEISTLSP